MSDLQLLKRSTNPQNSSLHYWRYAIDTEFQLRQQEKLFVVQITMPSICRKIAQQVLFSSDYREIVEDAICAASDEDYDFETSRRIPYAALRMACKQSRLNGS